MSYEQLQLALDIPTVESSPRIIHDPYWDELEKQPVSEPCDNFDQCSLPEQGNCSASINCTVCNTSPSFTIAPEHPTSNVGGQISLVESPYKSVGEQSQLILPPNKPTGWRSIGLSEAVKSIGTIVTAGWRGEKSIVVTSAVSTARSPSRKKRLWSWRSQKVNHQLRLSS